MIVSFVIQEVELFYSSKKSYNQYYKYFILFDLVIANFLLYDKESELENPLEYMGIEHIWHHNGKRKEYCEGEGELNEVRSESYTYTQMQARAHIGAFS